MSTDNTEKSSSDMTIVASSYLLFGLAVGFGFASCTNKGAAPHVIEPAYTMTRLDNMAVAVMKNETGEVTFYATDGTKMIEIPNPRKQAAMDFVEKLDFDKFKAKP